MTSLSSPKSHILTVWKTIPSATSHFPGSLERHIQSQNHAPFSAAQRAAKVSSTVALSDLSFRIAMLSIVALFIVQNPM